MNCNDDDKSIQKEVGNRERLLRARARLLEMVPTFTVENLGTLLRIPYIDACKFVNDARKSGRAFAVRHGCTWLYPQLQFDHSGGLYVEVNQLLLALGASATGWDVMQWLVERNEDLDGQTPLETWTTDRTRVVKSAKQAHWFTPD